MLIDAFLGFDEYELANFRINYLSNLVDLTLIFESRHTHSGLMKPLYFSEWHKNLEPDLKSRIKIIEIDLTNFNSPWEREIGSREFAMDYLRDNFTNDKFILSDIDEIPSREQILEMLTRNEILHFRTPTYYRKINWALKDNHASWSRGVFGEVAKAVYPNGARFTKSIPVISDNPGAHFSYLGFDAVKLQRKLTSFAHTELIEYSHNSEEIINLCDKYGLDHLGRFYTKGFGLLQIEGLHNNAVVSAAIKSFPQFFDSNTRFNFWIGKRLFYSALITTYYNFHGKKTLNTVPKYSIFFTFLKGILLGFRRIIFKTIRN